MTQAAGDSMSDFILETQGLTKEF
ncbi:MAG: hypothetical protein ACD_10C00052G0002, partial [uncultured bacterium]